MASRGDRPMWRGLWLWAPVLALMAAIFLLSSTPNLPAPPGGLSDVVAHGLAYAVLGVAMVRALSGGRLSRVGIRTIVWAVCLTVAYGVSDELHQRFVPGRFSEFRDIVADGVGALVGVGLAWAWGIVSRRP